MWNNSLGFSLNGGHVLLVASQILLGSLLLVNHPGQLYKILFPFILLPFITYY
jgi:hypothetical protein